MSLHRARHAVVALMALALLANFSTTQAAPAGGHDVIVYGGTPGGIAAAVMAAREGSTVLLIEPTRHVGGLNTSGLTTAETEHMLNWTLGGFAMEFYRGMGAHYGLKGNRPALEFESKVAEDEFLKLLKLAGVDIQFGSHLSKASRHQGAIRSITLTDGNTFSGKVFVDASYEGDLMAHAGVAHAIGREGKKEYGEELAGLRFDRKARTARTVDKQGRLLPGISGWKKDHREGAAHPGVMNFNFRLIVTRDPQHRVPFPKPENYDPGRYRLLANWLQQAAGKDEEMRLGKIIDLYGRRNGKFEMNNRQASIVSLGHLGGQFGWSEANEKERRRIYADHLDHTLGLLHFLATEEAVPPRIRREISELGLHADEFTDNGHLPYQLYVREGRRLRGRYVMRQQDIQTQRRKDDSIGMGSHFMDCHHVQRLAVSPTEFINEGRIWRKGSAYQIPYRAITPSAEQCTNLLVPVAASFTHVAYCTLRVEGTWMVTGHAAGVAASMAAKNGSPVQQVPVPDLQQKLKTQGQVVDFLPRKAEHCRQLHGPEEF